MPLRNTLLKSLSEPVSSGSLTSGIRERLGEIPDAYRSIATGQMYLNDTLYNVRRMFAPGELDVPTKHLLAVAIAGARLDAAVTEAMALEARVGGVDDESILEALTVSASITSHNIFYKFQHLAGNGYGDFKPQMKLSVLTRPSVLSILQVELICAVVSVINDCPYCVRVHVAKCRDLGATPGQIEEALRVGAVVAGMAVFAAAG